MSKLPTDDHLTDWATRVRKWFRHRHKGGQGQPPDVDPLPTWTELTDQVRTIFTRARTPGPTLERMRARTLNGMPGGHATILVTDEDGYEEAVPVTALEASYFASHDDDDDTVPVKDILDRLARSLWADCLQVEVALGRLRAKADLIDRIQSPTSRSETGGAGNCEACRTLVTGAAGDRLRSGYCPACYIAWIRKGRPDRAQFTAARRRTDEQGVA